MNWSTNFCFN